MEKSTYLAGFGEAWECQDCGHIMSHLLNSCCFECGAPEKNIKLITGRWEWEVIKKGWWIFKHETEKRGRFVKRQENEKC